MSSFRLDSGTWKNSDLSPSIYIQALRLSKFPSFPLVSGTKHIRGSPAPSNTGRSRSARLRHVTRSSFSQSLTALGHHIINSIIVDANSSSQDYILYKMIYEVDASRDHPIISVII